jgi:hypothetical protein
MGNRAWEVGKRGKWGSVGDDLGSGGPGEWWTLGAWWMDTKIPAIAQSWVGEEGDRRAGVGVGGGGMLTNKVFFL